LRVTMKLEKEQWKKLASKEFHLTLFVVVAQ
jgi:hypothetical protein